MAKRDPLRPLRWSHSNNGNSVYNYRCSCGWKIEVTRYSSVHWEFDVPDYNAAQGSHLQIQEAALRLKRGHELTECPNSRKRN